MGTRSLTHVKEGDKDSATLVTVYRQFDGYPEGQGRDLYLRFKEHTITNGYAPGMSDKNKANGMQCLAAQVVAHMKGGLGGVYIFPADTEKRGEEFVYTLYTLDNETLRIEIRNTYGEGETLYDGTIRDMWRHFEFQPEDNARKETLRLLASAAGYMMTQNEGRPSAENCLHAMAYANFLAEIEHRVPVESMYRHAQRVKELRELNGLDQPA